LLSNIYDFLELTPTLGAIALTAIVSKWLDAYLDDELTQTQKQNGLAYCLMALLIAGILDFPVTVALFFACYIVGMFTNMQMILPSGMPGWLESVIVAVLSVVFCGVKTTVWSLFVIIAIQLLDDVLDVREDQQHRHANIAFFLGVERTFLLFLIPFYISMMINPLLSVAALALALLVANVLFSWEAEDNDYELSYSS